jgi:hypothetical protein
MRYGERLRGTDPPHNYPPWVVYAMGVVTGLIIGWTQHAAWAARLTTER